jgi:site-specific DNA-methyltransferase (adenine-specific)
LWQHERFGEDQQTFVYDTFENQLAMMIADTSHWQSGTWEQQKVITGDALKVVEALKDERFDSIIFSPPYANRFDYFEALKVELWFGNFVNSYSELNNLRKTSVRSHLGADLNRPALEIDLLETLIDLMDRDSSSWRMGVPFALRGYFDDMYCILVQCRSLLAGGRCYIVVGNSAFAGVIFPTDSLIAHLGLKAGFSSVHLMEVRHLTVAPQQRNVLRGLEGHMRETVVVLE